MPRINRDHRRASKDGNQVTVAESFDPQDVEPSSSSSETCSTSPAKTSVEVLVQQCLRHGCGATIKVRSRLPIQTAALQPFAYDEDRRRKRFTVDEFNRAASAPLIQRAARLPAACVESRRVTDATMAVKTDRNDAPTQR